MQVFSIYKATNRINNKVYIGFDSNWPKRRNDRQYYCYSNSIFHKAIKKYGFNSFDWEVISQSLDGEYLLNVLEPYFIEQYNSHYITGHGYNMTYGGEGTLGHKHSKETIIKLREISKSCHPNLGKFGPMHPKYGKKFGRKPKISESLKQAVVCEGIQYNSVGDAELAYRGIKLRSRLDNPKYPEFYRLFPKRIRPRKNTILHDP